MKNVKKYQVKKTIILSLEQYKEIITEITDGLKSISCEIDGLFYDDTDKAVASDEFWEKDILEELSTYFDVTVTSVHIDDCDEPGVWICFDGETLEHDPEKVIDKNKWPLLQSETNCFDTLRKLCSDDYLDELEEQLRWYNYEATDEDIGECGENLSGFLVYVYGSAGSNDWLEDLIEELGMDSEGKKTK